MIYSGIYDASAASRNSFCDELRSSENGGAVAAVCFSAVPCIFMLVTFRYLRCCTLRPALFCSLIRLINFEIISIGRHWNGELLQFYLRAHCCAKVFVAFAARFF